MTAKFALTVADILASPPRIAELRAVHADPGHPLPPATRSLYKRLSLIVQISKKRGPALPGRHGKVPPRRHALTGRGLELIETAPPDPVKPVPQPRQPNGRTWVNGLSLGMRSGRSGAL